MEAARARLVENELVKAKWTDEVVDALLDREWSAQPALSYLR